MVFAPSELFPTEALKTASLAYLDAGKTTEAAEAAEALEALAPHLPTGRNIGTHLKLLGAAHKEMTRSLLEIEDIRSTISRSTKGLRNDWAQFAKEAVAAGLPVEPILSQPSTLEEKLAALEKITLPEGPLRDTLSRIRGHAKNLAWVENLPEIVEDLRASPLLTTSQLADLDKYGWGKYAEKIAVGIKTPFTIEAAEGAYKVVLKPLAQEAPQTSTALTRIVKEAEEVVAKSKSRKWLVGGIAAAVVAVGAFLVLNKKSHVERESERRAESPQAQART